MNNENLKDLEMMKPKLFDENKIFCLTPENKLEKWIKIIQQKAIDGYKVKLYSDIESTGFAYWSRGRAIFDEIMDEVPLRKDAEKFFIEIDAIKNKDSVIKITHPMCQSKKFSMKSPSYFSLFVLGKKVFEKNNFDFEEIISIINDYDNNEETYQNLAKLKYGNIYNELMINAKSEIKACISRAYKELKKESTDLSKKVDRMIEYAFVTCYENKDGEVFLLKDDEGDLIYFHEFINPNNDETMAKEKIISEMPLIPYIIHKTDFSFIKGEIVHPFLNIKLNKSAPTAKPVFEFLIKLFNYNEDPENKKLITENIMMFFHNGNGFDVPFIDAEFNKFFEGKKLRNYVQSYDTLKIAKAMIPSDVQKFIAACQYNKNFGGDEDLKLNDEIAIMPTSKSLDNVKRLASFLIDFDPNKPKIIYTKAQDFFYKSFVKYFESLEIDWKKFDNMLEYSSNKNPDISLIKGFPKPSKDAFDYSNLIDRYNKYLEGRKEYIQALNKVKKFEDIYKNLNNIKENIKNNKYLSDALFRLNNVDRSAHGARVDSQLFMDTFIVLENAFYLKPKMSQKTRSLDIKDLKIPEDVISKLKKIKEGN